MKVFALIIAIIIYFDKNILYMYLISYGYPKPIMWEISQTFYRVHKSCTKWQEHSLCDLQAWYG